MPGCLIVTAAANEFAEETAGFADFRIPVKACTSADRALDEYIGQTIVFVNGQAALLNGAMTGARPGRVLRSGATTPNR